MVWFGEMLPAEALEAADAAVAHCDVCLSIGTSAVVYPVAGYIERAIAQTDTTTCEINPVSTALTNGFDFAIVERAGTALPPLVRATIEGGSPQH